LRPCRCGLPRRIPVVRRTPAAVPGPMWTGLFGRYPWTNRTIIQTRPSVATIARLGRFSTQLPSGTDNGLSPHAAAAQAAPMRRPTSPRTPPRSRCSASPSPSKDCCCRSGRGRECYLPLPLPGLSLPGYGRRSLANLWQMAVRGSPGMQEAGCWTRPALMVWGGAPAGIEPATPSLPWNHQEPLCEPPFPQVALDRKGLHDQATRVAEAASRAIERSPTRTRRLRPW
jgi:hypothetical protein